MRASNVAGIEIERVKSFRTYAIGAIVLYIGLFIHTGTGTASVLGAQIASGLFLGSMLWAFSLPVCLLVQWVGLKSLRRRNKLTQTNALLLPNIPIFCIALYFVVSPLFSNEDEQAFRTLVTSAPLSSLKLSDSGRFISIGSGIWRSFEFEASDFDMQKILAEGKFLIEEDFGRSKHLIENKTGLKVNLEHPIIHYSAKTNAMEKHVLFSEKSPRRYFLYKN